jgi:hypothetical protein
MLEWGKLERHAIAAVARQFPADWQLGEAPPYARASLGGRKIALEVAIVGRQSATPQPPATVRLREDAVAQRVLRDIGSDLRPHVPKRKTIILTLGAPIKVPKRLVGELTGVLRDYLRSSTAERDEKKTLLGNRVRFRLLNDRRGWQAPVIAFVFSGDPKPGVLADELGRLRDTLAAAAKRPLPEGFAGERWLVLASDRWIADIKTYRLLHAQLSAPHPYQKILMLFKGARIETLRSS